MSENIGGYDKYSFNEDAGNDILRPLLQSKGTIKTHFAGEDKKPNLDDYFELLEIDNKHNKAVPVGRIDVQIKTMERDYINSNIQGTISKYKYSCDTKAINAAKRPITLNPIFILLVDVTNKRCFYIHLSDELLLRLGTIGDEKMLYFNEENEIIIDKIDDFHAMAIDIFNNYKRKSVNGEENKLTITSVLSSEDTRRLQQAVDKFNGLLDNELFFIKKHIFPSVWKFGLAYSLLDNGVITGIYSIRMGENGVFIREFNFDNEKSSIYVSISNSTDIGSVDFSINECLRRVIKDFFTHGFIDVQNLPTEVLGETVFSFLDEVARHCHMFQNINYPNVYYRDSEVMAEVESIWKALIGMSCDYIKKYHCDQKIIEIIDPFFVLRVGKEPESIQFARDSFYAHYNNDVMPKKSNFLCVFKGSFPYNMMKAVINEAQRRQISKIERPWKHKDYNNFKKDIEHLSGLERIETGYRIQDYTDNLLKMFSILPDRYDLVSSRVLGRYHNEMRIKKHYHIGIANNGTFDCFYVAYESERFIVDVAVTNAPDLSSYIEQYSGYDVRGDVSIDGLFRRYTPLYDYIVRIIYRSICQHIGIRTDSIGNIIGPI